MSFFKGRSGAAPKWQKRLRFFTFFVTASLLLFEWVYRIQIVDFYSTELEALNVASDLEDNHGKSKTVLVGGDSFTASPNSFVNTLREVYPEYRFINAAVPGTGIIEAEIIADERMADFEPDVFIYQVYIGNDLWDLNRPANWDSISFMRNVYWQGTEYLRSWRYVNYKMGQVKYQLNMETVDSANLKLDIDEFDAAKYSAREKLYYQCEPSLIGNSVLLQNGREEDMADWLNEFESMTADMREAGKEVKVVLLPHCAQVHQRYYQSMQQIGATLPPAEQLMIEDYPFAQKVRERLPEVEIINPLSRMQQEERKGTELYYANDPHLNDQGHDVIAAILVDHLLD